ncbi:MAG: hypothetical protein K0S55_1578 [Clostridia bacterium]|nr:hypothetical protein [Clostridia bacterium]
MNFKDVLAIFNKKISGSFKAPERILPKDIKNVFIPGKVCAFSGYRPQKLPFTSEDDDKCIYLKNELRREIIIAIESGYKNFISGMALGVDIWAAELVIEIKNLYEPWGEKIKLFAAVPCPEQSSRWQEWQKEHYNDILECCEKIFVVSDKYTPECMNNRNGFMVERANMLIAVYDGKAGGTANTIAMANRKGIPIKIINPNNYNQDNIQTDEIQTTLI